MENHMYISVLLQILISVTTSRLTKVGLLNLKNSSFKSQNQQPVLYRQKENLTNTEDQREKIESFFLPAAKINSRKLKSNIVKKSILKHVANNQLGRLKRKSVLLDVRIPLDNSIKPIAASESTLFTDSQTESDLSKATPQYTAPPLSPKYTLPDLSPQLKSPNLSYALPVNHPYLSTLYLSDLTTVNPEGLKHDNTNVDNKNDSLNDLPTIPTDDEPDEQTNVEASTQEPDPTVQILTVTPMAARGPRESSLTSPPSTSCYTHTVTWLGRCVVLCDRQLIRPCLFNAME